MPKVVYRPWGGWRSEASLRRLLRHSSVARVWSLGDWRHGGTVTTVKVPFGSTWSTWRLLFDRPDRVLEFAQELAEAGLSDRVSSYTSAWRQLSPMPPRLATEAAPVLRRRGDRPRAWEEAREPGWHPGAWVEWDLSSAYAWSMARGLPDLRTCRPVDRLDEVDDDGYYLVELPLRNESGDVEPWILPTWLRPQDWVRSGAEGLGYLDELDDGEGETPAGPGRAWVPGELLNGMAYSGRVAAGVTWSARFDFARPLDRLRRAFPSSWRKVFSRGWGDYGHGDSRYFRVERGRVVRHCRMPGRLSAPLWADLIQARVAARMSRVADLALRVFVDSATLPAWARPAPVGREPGEWHVKARFPDGAYVPADGGRPRPEEPLPVRQERQGYRLQAELRGE